MKFILGTVFLLGQVLLCLSQSGGGEANADASVELPCGLNQKILDKAKGALNISTINLPILRCLCQLKIKSSASAGGSVSAGGADASASVDVGIDLNTVGCDGVLNPDPSKKISYELSIGRQFVDNNTDIPNSYIFIPELAEYRGDYESTIIKDMKKGDSLSMILGKMGYGSAKYLIKTDDDKSIEEFCDDAEEGTDKYNFLKIMKYVLAGGNDCPIKKDTKAPNKYEYDPITVTVNDPWPCGTLYVDVNLKDSPDSPGYYGILGRWNWYVGNDCIIEKPK